MTRFRGSALGEQPLVPFQQLIGQHIHFWLRIAILFVSAALFACGGSSSNTTYLSPMAVASASPSSGTAPLAVTFNANGSSDPQGLPLTFQWNFGDGTALVTGAVAPHVYNNHGAYTATVAVSNGHLSTTQRVKIAVNPAPPTVQPLAINLSILGIAPSATTGQLQASDREHLALTYVMTTPPTIGTASINQHTGQISYSVPGQVSATIVGIGVSVSNFAASTASIVTVNLNSDPLLPNQWHIQNVGQNAFSSMPPVAGNDIDVAPAWSAGYSGKGIKVGIVDTGLEVNHEDLQANVDLSHSFNFLTGSNDPSPTGTGFDHGTAVAGLIGAVAFNGKGGRGVAYSSTLRGYNLLALPFVTSANLATAMGSAPVSADNDLFNASFELLSGQGSSALPSVDEAFQAISQTASTLRSGLGAAFVIAGGNDFLNFQYDPSSSCTTYAQLYGVSCGDPASDPRRTDGYGIIVAATNAAGSHASYSSTGSALWISAPGGESGFNAYIVGPGASDYQPALVTTSREGCPNANYPTAVNTLDDLGANPLAPNCQYTATMNGTSAATPNTTATAALMLDANPKLTVRDIKYILASTAKRIDPNFPGVTATTLLPGSTIVLEQGWVTNAAGYTFSNRYGFGEIDAGVAVKMAGQYKSYLPPLRYSKGQYAYTAATPGIVPAASAAGTLIPFNVTEQFSTVEFVTVVVNLTATPALACNQIELTSPSGTNSILLHAANGFRNAAVANTRLESNAFYGEPVNGRWVLTFFDFCQPTAVSTTLSLTQPQVLQLAGH